MSLPAPSIVDRTKKWIKLLTRRSRSSTSRLEENTSAEFFTNAQDLTINGGNFINDLKINYINDVVSSNQAVFELLEPHTCLDAALDSSARHPPPRCHAKTRVKIRERLTRWLFDEYDEWKMMWVRGSAGTGKSAVAQSFGDSCGETQRHGASYFFSRTAGRNKSETVVPTIVCQLATTIPEYRSIIGHQLANNPFLLRKSPPVQFRKLIVEPFMALQLARPREPVVIILDGLDECEGEASQREILEMITNAIRQNPDLPLRWLIFSRPEAHLKNTFSRNLLCGREELVIDAECREDVERYVKDRLVEIQNAYDDVSPADWPPPDKLQELLDAVSGLFVFASTCLNFIGDPDKSNPPSQLDSLLAFMHRSQGVVSRNPLAVLDLLYSRILEKVPTDVYGTTRRLLAYMCYRDRVDSDNDLSSAQALCNFLRFDRQTFYGATRGLHSVTGIPEPEDADQSQIRFYHASFQDFLLDPNRSGKFYIGEQDAVADIVQSGAHWCEIDASQFHADDGWDFNFQHSHDSLPGLTWASPGNKSQISRSITVFIETSLFHKSFSLRWNSADQTFLSQLSKFDFRYWPAINIIYLARLCQLDPSTSVVRVEPSCHIDNQLLEHLNLVTANGVVKQAKFPLRRYEECREWIREYFFIGHGIKSVIVWTTKSPTSHLEYEFSLRCDQEPSEAQISDYARYLREIEWDEASAKVEMR